ncbi:hypothetical protein C8J56DRAFT_777276 [Mycena floridula]|nr:hypothetical protein C8J56DRAFT_777276 [Mycena floridula]
MLVKVKLRTVDNFQGEEAKIVILSLVRNAGSEENSGSRPNIGFLKSENRANVALSRAKEGLFILGNAPQMASRSPMWREVIEAMEEQGCIGPGVPISCHQHPETVEWISKPGMLPRFAPDGGCLKPCNARLNCGHVCPYKCHPDDPAHIAVTCVQDCSRLCARGHPCSRPCANDCGQCMFEIPGVQLPCGHRPTSLFCYQMDDLTAVPCTEVVEKALPTCEHSTKMRCMDNPSEKSCTATCLGTMACCGRDCNSKCSECQHLTGITTETLIKTRTKHQPHPCKKPLYCAHLCVNSCSQDHSCTTSCQEACRQECIHSICRRNCSTPCAPCQKNCPHFTCPVPCGSVCVRLPCDKRCEKTLNCGHQCPSVCGEDCETQKCPACASPDEKDNIVDLIMGITLREIPQDAIELDELIITLPKCRHTFTVETLDGICSMNDVYLKDETGKWTNLQPARDSSKNSPPVCPTCRASITSPRYGRIFKSADLDILEKNVISRMTQSLASIQQSIQRVSKAEIEQALTSQAAQLDKATMPKEVSTNALKAMAKKKKELIMEHRLIPARILILDPMNALYNISPLTAEKWRKATVKVTQIYADAFRVATTRSAHLKAWEASFSLIFHAEMEAAAQNPLQAPRNPRQFAMQMGKWLSIFYFFALTDSYLSPNESWTSATKS